MNRHELKIYGAWIVASTITVSAAMVGLRLLGARDDLTAVLVVGVFAFTMFLGGFLPEDSPPDRR